MNRKISIMSLIAVMAVTFFSGCSNKNNENSGNPSVEESQTNASITEENTTENNSAVSDVEETQTNASITEEDTMENNSAVSDVEQTGNFTNLSESTNVGVCIDYVIDSYETIQRFGYDLFAQNLQDKNPVLSPVSAYLALSMAGCGADGTTKDEFYRVLGNDMMELSDDMMNTLPEEGELLKLSIGNSAWIDDEFAIENEWLGTIKSIMDAEAFQMNLSSQEAVNRINRWVLDKTNGMIDKLIDSPFDALAKIVLLDTVYFKGKWEMPFEAENTHLEEFYLDKVQRVSKQVNMMNQYNTYMDYVANDFVEGVILPYQNNMEEGILPHQSVPYREPKLAFIALKPVGNRDIREIYSRLTAETIAALLRNRQNELVDLKLPKFEITFDKELNQSLLNMGLTECFDARKANFGQMGETKGDGNLYISLVRQKAKIIVDEEGTEAAAVTEIEMRAAGAINLEPPRVLYFNEPFFYMIMDMDREIPLFIGILDNPVSNIQQ